MIDSNIQLNILDIAKSNAAVLSSVSVPRWFKQARLIGSDDSIIVVDGEEYDIKIPNRLDPLLATNLCYVCYS